MYNIFLIRKGEKFLLITVSTQSNSYHKRKRQYSSTQSNPPAKNSIKLHENSIKKPLKVRGTSTPTFEGFSNFKAVEKIFATTTEKLPQSLAKKTFETLKELSKNSISGKTKNQHAVYDKIVTTFIEAVQNDAAFRKTLRISDDWAKNISIDNLPKIPQKAQARKFIETLFDPIVELVNLYKPVARSKFGKRFFPKLHNKLLKEKQQELLIDNYKGFLGLSDSIKIWENSYRKSSRNPQWNDKEEFLIPQDILLGKIQRRRQKAFGQDKGKYSTKSLMLGNRLISGLVYSVYLSTDAFNTTMRFSGSKEESQKQQKSRFAQENARIGLNLYLQNLIFSTFESQMNKNLGNALLASGATVALSEIVGRQLVSKPIMPSDKKTLDSMEQEMLSKKGFLPSLGRLMTRVKKTESANAANIKPSSANQNQKIISPALPKTFAVFTSNQVKNNNASQVAFTGAEKVAQMFDSKNLEKLLNVIKDFDLSQYKYYTETIEKGLSGKTLDEFIKSSSSVPIGESKTLQTRVVESVLAPVGWVKNIGKSMVKLMKGLSPEAKRKELLDFIKDKPLADEFQVFKKNRLELKVWQNSRLSETEKETKILEEFVDMKNKIKEEIQGVKNVLLWLDKQVKANKFDLSKLSAEQKATLENMLEKVMISSDGAKQVEYDGNTLAQLNIHLARVITTIFLVTDAYNLTMQYANDNKKDARKSAKGRAVQEVTRISISAYMLGFIHNLLSKVCNSSLLGAFGVTLLTSVTNDTLTRLAVGVPLTPKKQEELLKKDKNK